MSFARLTIHYEAAQGDFSQSFEALFNPGQLTYTRNVNWAPKYTIGKAKESPGFYLKYDAMTPETLAVELFFDTYSKATTASDGLLGLLPSSGPAAESVLTYTDAVAALASVNIQLGRPPVCKLSWGKVQLFQGVLQQTTRTLLLFLPDGTPVRASMSCTFQEFPGDPRAVDEKLSSGTEKTYIVRPHDTLMGISAAEYGDPSLWRDIANANNLTNPRDLEPGTELTIPLLR